MIFSFIPLSDHTKGLECGYLYIMQLDDAKLRFTQSWGTLGSNWGINRTMAQIHALLLVTKEPICAEDVMEALQISRGNANMNLRSLMDWGLVHKEMKPGERREFFVAEKDIWEVARRIIAERKKREIEPVSRVLEEVSQVKGSDPETVEFREMIKKLQDFVNKMDKLSETASKSDRNWFMKSLMKILLK